jgi:uncharacterized protein YndB with AHSA1/START domain
MAEFEADRRMPADAETVFAVVSDLDRLAEWLPPSVAVAPTAAGEVHARVDPRDIDVDGLVDVRREQLRLEWGSEDSPDYAGWLQVYHAEPGHSSVSLHLSFLGDQPETRQHGNAADEVRAWMDDALSRLEDVVAGASSPLVDPSERPGR